MTEDSPELNLSPDAEYLLGILTAAGHINASTARQARELTHEYGRESPPTIPADVGRRAMEALTNVCKNFPTDFDMADLGWDSLTVEAACTAYDKARASITELQQALAAPSGGQRTTPQEQGERRE